MCLCVCVSKNKRVFERVERSNVMAWRRKGKGSDGEGSKVDISIIDFHEIEWQTRYCFITLPERICMCIYIYICMYVFIQSPNLSRHNPHVFYTSLSFPSSRHIATNRIRANQLSFEFRLIGWILLVLFFSFFIPLLVLSPLLLASLPLPLRVKNLFANFSSLELVLKGCTFLTPFISE